MQSKDLENNPPKVLSIEKLPAFIQIAVADLWEKNGIEPTQMTKKSLVFTYFDAIYTATTMPTDLFVHEAVHYARQGNGKNEKLAKEWWLRYCSDAEFRYQEELMAYKEQYKYILSQVKGNRAIAFEHAKRLAYDLSGAIYGNLTSFPNALNDIIKK